MSGIAGLVYFDGRADHEGVLRRMMQSIEHRQPAGLAFSGAHTLVADARLDNSPENSTDHAYIHEMWRAWGDDCARQLFGDFAFAIWDDASKSVFCARDHIGVRPFYYFHKPGAFFIFASQIRALFAHPEVPRRLNKRRVAEALAAVLTDQSSTYYEDIFRLSAAHTLRVSKENFRLRRYWALDPEREEKFAANEDAIEGFRHHFTNAVRSRLRTPHKVAVELSGGLDSSAVACVARDLAAQPLPTYSVIFPSVPASDERPFIEAVLEKGGFAPVFVNGDEAGPLTPFEAFLDYEDEGSYGTNFFLRDVLHRAMQRDGVRVFLDGFDGDTTVGHGNLRLAELAAAGEWPAFDEELKAVASRRNLDRWSAALTFGGPGLRGKSVREIREAAPHFGRRWGRLLYETKFKSPPINRFLTFLRGAEPTWLRHLPALLNPDFAGAMNIREMISFAERSGPDVTERERLIRLIGSGSFSFGLERYDYHAAASGLEARHPFADVRLVEFSASLPSRFRLRNGFDRWIMRQALAGILPEKVATRSGKGNLNWNFLRGFLTTNAAVLDRWLYAEGTRIERVVNVPVARELIQEWRASGHPRDPQKLFALFRVLTTARWMGHVGLSQ